MHQTNSTKNSDCREVIPENIVRTIRRTPMTFGDGLIEAIPDEAILANQQNPTSGGTAHMVKLLEDPDGPARVGRFGWKAQLATTLSFAADASNNEMGISNELLPQEQRPNAAASASDGTLPCDDGVADPDDRPGIDGVRFIDELRDFLRYLAPPPQTPKSGMRGEQIFKDIGCAFCHVPSFITAANEAEPVLSEQEIKVYSDFLLHDMGELGDGIAQGAAGPRMMKTPPLWGLKYNLSLFHDGRAFLPFIGEPGQEGALNNLADLVAKHNTPGSEAGFAAQNYANLSAEQKADLLAFLKSLGRAEFDHDNFQGLTAQDFRVFRNCYEGIPAEGEDYGPDHACAISDINQDRKVDEIDVQSLITVYRGPIDDCQCNGKMDLLEILENPMIDGNDDASPDECRMLLDLVGPFGGGINNGLEVKDGVVSVSFSVLGNLQEGDAVEVFYSFVGQGQGPDWGSAYCLNLSGPQLLGRIIAAKRNNFWNTEFSAVLPVPPGTEKMFFQAGIYNGGQGSKKSQVVSREVMSVAPTAFIRGDANIDEKIDLTDAVFILRYLFRNGDRPSCIDSADVNDDGGVDVSDAVRLLLFLFRDGNPLPVPSPNKGVDPTSDGLGCGYYP